jgi:hypothetical protein
MLRRFFSKAVVMAIAACAVLALSSVLLAQGRSEQALERVIEVQVRHTARLMAIEGVVGTAVGRNPNARLAVTVLLERPGVGGIPQQLEGVPVHPVVTGEIYALPKGGNGGGNGGGKPDGGDPVDRTARFERPVPIGVSTGHPAITAGTIGCRVTDGTNVYALSNNHVYADNDPENIGDAVIQPGKFDGGLSPADDIGRLVDFVTIDFGGINIVDAAIAATEEPKLGTSTPSDGYGAPKSVTATAYLNQKVKKYGRTTGLTKGQVAGINAAVAVNYGGGNVALFLGQIIITPGAFSAGGDSGSLVVVDGKGRDRAHDRKPVGLLFAGSALHTIACPIDAVLTRFGVTIDGE